MKTDDWMNPPEIYQALDKEFRFTLDGCEAGIDADWGGETVWGNPPYGKQAGEWVQKAATSAALVVLLLPARTDSEWFHKYIYRNPFCDVRFIRGRLKYLKNGYDAPFPSMIAIFHNDRKRGLLNE